MLSWICMAVNIGILAYGGYVDYKKREIPNAVPIILLLTGLISAFPILLFRLAGLVIIGGAFLLAAKLTNGETPGGDFKLLCALAFSAGIPTVLAVLLLSGMMALLVGLIRKKGEFNRHIPLCTYVAPAYVIACFIIYIT